MANGRPTTLDRQKSWFVRKNQAEVQATKPSSLGDESLETAETEPNSRCSPPPPRRSERPKWGRQRSVRPSLSKDASTRTCFELPEWENPSEAVSTTIYDNVKTTPTSTPVIKAPQQGSTKATQTKHSSNKSSDMPLTNMEITCDSSFSSSVGTIDDLTHAGSCDGEEITGSNRRPQPTSMLASYSDDASISMAEIVQEEEMIRLAMQRSIEDSTSTLQVAHTVQNTNSFASMPESNTPAKNFIWKRGPNGKFKKYPVGPLGQVEMAPRQNETEDERIQRMEDEMLERAMEQSVHEENVKSDRQASLASNAEKTVQEQEALLLEIAMDQSLADSVPSQKISGHQECSRSQRSSYSQPRSYSQPSTSNLAYASRPTRSHSSKSGDSITQARYERPTSSSSRLNGNGSLPHMSLGSSMPHMSLGRSSSTRRPLGGGVRVGFLHQPSVQRSTRHDLSGSFREDKNFVWKRDANNRFIKVPIAMGQLVENEEYTDEDDITGIQQNDQQDESENGRLERMERQMMEEAMHRSMQDLRGWES